jgi:hypothetical protein
MQIIHVQPQQNKQAGKLAPVKAQYFHWKTIEEKFT